MVPKNKEKQGRSSAVPRRWPLLLGTIVLAGVIAFMALWLARKLAPAQPQTQSAMVESDFTVFARYAGSASCRECHHDAFNLWKSSHHAQAERALDASVDRASFDPSRVFKHASQTSEARCVNGQFEIVATGAGGERKAFSLARRLGVEPLRQFLAPADGGRFQVTEVAVDSRSGDWFDIFGDEDRQPGEWGHWTGRGMTWNAMCAACHNTRVRKNYEAANDSYRTSMAELGVGCEACHGPMARHAAWQHEHSGRKTPDPTLRSPGKEQMLATCGSCHARRAELTGDFRSGDSFFDHYMLSIPDETDLFYPDGQVRQEDYEYTSFLGSRMHAAGVRCQDCHAPHSGKLLASGNDLCLRCHNGTVPPAPRIDPAAHSFHPPSQAGSRCVDCHMPQTVYMQRHARRDHGFTIPDPLLTKEHQIPNACNRCHRERSVDWALQAVEKWYGARMERPTRTRARWLAEARAGHHGAVGHVQRLLREEKIPLWRAAAAELLKRWCAEPPVEAALLEATGDADPLVRVAAAQALEPVAQSAGPNVRTTLGRLLSDPVRAVRVEAAWALRSNIDTNSNAGQELLHYLAHNADQPSGSLQIGAFLFDRGDNDGALQHFQRAAAWDKNSPPLRQALAVSLSLQGRNEEAIKELEAACRLAPKESEYRFKLGLALNEAGRLAEAAAALEKAVELEPQFAQAWYNLGLAYSAAEKAGPALEALTRAESLDAAAARIPYARATILARQGRVDEARAAARRALEIQPDFSEAATLLQTLSPGQR